MTTTPHSGPLPPAPVARLSGAGEVAAALPALVGFVPTHSLLVVSLRGPRSRVGLVARVDLPPPQEAPAVVAALVRALVRDRAERVLVLVWSEQPDTADALPHGPLVEVVARALRRARLPLDDAVLVRAGAWRSYRCSDAACCPPGGTPLPLGTPALGLVAAAGALSGRAVLPDRAALAASIAPVQGPGAEQARRTAAAVRRAREREARRLGRLREAARSLAAVRAALHDVEQEPGAPLPAEVVARVAVALDDVPVRDEVLRLLDGRGEPLLGLLLQVARRTPPPDDAGVCAALGAAAHVGGDGALARLALDRALATDPGHGLALLLHAALDAALPPDEVRRALTGPARHARRRRR